MLNICLIGHSTKSRNLGVGALTVSEIAIVRRLAQDLGLAVHITVIDWKASLPSYVSGPDVTLHDISGKSLIDPRDVLAHFRRADLVIDIGAGDSFADIYGPARLARMYAMKYLVHLARRPLVHAPQTLGPFTRPLSRVLARQSLRWSAVNATRDAMSTACARELGFTGDIIEASDVALRLPYDPPAPRAAGGPVKVGLNVSGLLMNGGYDRKNMFGLTTDYPALMRDILRFFTTHPGGCEVHLVSHVVTWRASVEDDYQAALTLQQDFPGVIVADAFRTPSAAKTYIAGLDFFAGARMHACIAAFSSGVPVVPMAYSRKFEGLFGSLGYNHTVDCTRETGEAILAKITAAYENRAGLEADRAAALARGLEKLGLYEAALGRLMQDRARAGATPNG